MYRNPLPVAAAVVLNEIREVLLIKRKHWPFEGAWAIPGGFVEMDETLEAAAKRELQEETGLSDLYLEQLYTFGDPGRDPRGRTITVTYFAVVHAGAVNPQAADDAADVGWWSIYHLPPLAFDHDKILQNYFSRQFGRFARGIQKLPKTGS